jgi:hypothetical protein
MQAVASSPSSRVKRRWFMRLPRSKQRAGEPADGGAEKPDRGGRWH